MIGTSGPGILSAAGSRPPSQPGGAEYAPLPHDMISKAVLIIEDEAIIAWMMEDFLRALGFAAITVVASAEDALDHARVEAPGLIVSDINLGRDRVDGVTAVTQIVAATPAPVVFITGYASPETAASIERDIGEAQILRKPVSQDDLHRALSALSGQRKSH